MKKRQLWFCRGIISRKKVNSREKVNCVAERPDLLISTIQPQWEIDWTYNIVSNNTCPNINSETTLVNSFIA